MTVLVQPSGLCAHTRYPERDEQGNKDTDAADQERAPGERSHAVIPIAIFIQRHLRVLHTQIHIRHTDAFSGARGRERDVRQTQTHTHTHTHTQLPPFKLLSAATLHMTPRSLCCEQTHLEERPKHGWPKTRAQAPNPRHHTLHSTLEEEEQEGRREEGNNQKKAWVGVWGKQKGGKRRGGCGCGGTRLPSSSLHTPLNMAWDWIEKKKEGGGGKRTCWSAAALWERRALTAGYVRLLNASSPPVANSAQRVVTTPYSASCTHHEKKH